MIEHNPRDILRLKNCPACRYDLRGIESERCPECGAVIPPQHAERDPRDILRLKHSPTCRYDLRGIDSERCPECGEVIPPLAFEVPVYTADLDVGHIRRFTAPSEW